jgi:hypothetical protein
MVVGYTKDTNEGFLRHFNLSSPIWLLLRICKVYVLRGILDFGHLMGFGSLAIEAMKWQVSGQRRKSKCIEMGCRCTPDTIRMDDCI